MKTCLQILKEKQHQEIISVTPDCLVFDVLIILAEHKIGAVAVLEGDKLVGIFSERDYAREVTLKGKSSKDTLISDVMTSKVLTVKPDDLVDYCMGVMSNKRIRHLPVLDGDKIIGMLSVGDLVKETISYQADLIQQLESYIRG